MKAVIPAAGQGTRLFPQTHTKPKAMVRLAGRPILGHILSSLAETQVNEVVLIVGGPMQQQITKYARDAFGDRFDLRFIEQQSAEGLGHSIYQARTAVGADPALIVLGDMIFENGYASFLDAHEELGRPDASLGVKRVAEPSHYGVVETDGKRITRLVEKPDEPPSDYAISGVYIVEDTSSLFDSLEFLISNDIRGSGNEYQLTDALQRMIDGGSKMRFFEVEDWYDCGRPDTLLEANRVLLSRLDTETDIDVPNAVVIPPIDIGTDVTIESSVIGPHVSVDDGATIRDSIIRETIVGQTATLENVNLDESIVGSNATVRGEANHLNVGDSSTVQL